MKINIIKISLAACAAAMSLTAAAQNLDPTVVVNRAYEGKLLEVNKPVMEMAVPDSVQRFDLDFDYSVFANPYKGSYEFKPYQLLLKPVSADVHKSAFRLKAGAGYSLYPEVDAVWTPLQDGPFKMSVYGNYGGYFGSYRSFRQMSASGSDVVLGRWERDDKATAYWKGYRMRTTAGVDGRYDWEKSAFSFNVGYYGVAAKDTLKSRSFNAVDVNLKMASKPRSGQYFHYDVDVDYRYGNDGIEYRSRLDGLSEHLFSVGAELGSVMPSSDRLLIDAGFEMASYTDAVSATAAQIVLTPHYLISRDRWNFDLGLRLAKVFRLQDSDMYQAKDQVVYPDIRIRYAAIENALAIYFNAGGGNRLNTYSSLIERNQFADPTFARNSYLLDTDVERVSLRLGFDGRISKRFSYDIHAGYVNYANALLDAVAFEGGRYLSGFGYAPYQKLFAGIDWNCNAESISFDGSIEYAHAVIEKGRGLFCPPALSGKVSAEYNWNRRVFVGVDCDFATRRRGSIESVLAVIPAYADLGLNAEYAVSRKFSLWLRGGNLLNMTIQRNPLYAEKGINFTAGICLNL